MRFFFCPLFPLVKTAWAIPPASEVQHQLHIQTSHVCTHCTQPALLSNTSLTPLFHKQTRSALITTKLISYQKQIFSSGVHVTTCKKAANSCTPSAYHHCAVCITRHEPENSSVPRAYVIQLRGASCPSLAATGVISQCDAVRKKAKQLKKKAISSFSSPQILGDYSKWTDYPLCCL